MALNQHMGCTKIQWDCLVFLQTIWQKNHFKDIIIMYSSEKNGFKRKKILMTANSECYMVHWVWLKLSDTEPCPLHLAMLQLRPATPSLSLLDNRSLGFSSTPLFILSSATKCHSHVFSAWQYSHPHPPLTTMTSFPLIYPIPHFLSG